MNKIRPYLPFAMRLGSALVAAATPLYAVHWHPTPEVLEACVVAGGMAWKRWHPSASLSALLGVKGVPADEPASE